MQPQKYTLGTTPHAARRLEIQDRQFGAISESLLDTLSLAPQARVLELGVGAGSFSRRVLQRLGPGGTLVGVDFMQGLLDQAAANLQGVGSARLELVLSDIRHVAELAKDADAVVGRTVLHHLPFPEVFLGNLRLALRPATKLGFIEPEFRTLLGRLARLEGDGRTELAPLRRWAEGISRYYQKAGLAPTIGASLAATMTAIGYRQVRSEWWECPTDVLALENMQLYYEEVRERYVAAEIMTAAEIDGDRKLLASLTAKDLPPVWGMYCVTCEV